MREREVKRFRAIGALMESYAKEGKAEQAATISREVQAAGESVETASLKARFSRQGVAIERKQGR